MRRLPWVRAEETLPARTPRVTLRACSEQLLGEQWQHFPKGTDISVYSQSELNAVAKRLNGRPPAHGLLAGART